jgi:hypothetical protein
MTTLCNARFCFYVQVLGLDISLCPACSPDTSPDRPPSPAVPRCHVCARVWRTMRTSDLCESCWAATVRLPAQGSTAPSTIEHVTHGGRISPRLYSIARNLHHLSLASGQPQSPDPRDPGTSSSGTRSRTPQPTTSQSAAAPSAHSDSTPATSHFLRASPLSVQAAATRSIPNDVYQAFVANSADLSRHARNLNFAIGHWSPGVGSSKAPTNQQLSLTRTHLRRIRQELEKLQSSLDVNFPDQ